MKKSILIVDDALDTRKLLKLILAKNGFFSLLEAETGRSALEQLKKNSDIALVLLDYRLDDMTGYEVLQKIKHMNIDAKVCFISGNSDRSDIRSVLVGGAVDYILKPIDPYLICQKVMCFLNNHKMQFASYSTNMEGLLKGVPIEVIVQIIQVSEASIRFVSDVKFTNGKFQLQIDSLSKLTDYNQSFQFSIEHCEPISKNKFIVEANFLGLSETVLAKIRSLAINSNSKKIAI